MEEWTLETVDLLCLNCGTYFIERVIDRCHLGDITCPRCGAQSVLILDQSVFASGG
jgi:predicted RNA-binding Zn-ribbon protein involved in translation (DUF1610 family)